MHGTQIMCAATRLLIIDDDQELCELLTDYMGSAGFEIDAVHNPSEGIRRALSGQYALAVLDVMLPEMDGFEVLRRIRTQSALPILMLTARGEDVDRIVGLELGADDYLPKPFNARELVARIRAMLRRTQRDAPGYLPGREPRFIVDDLQLDPSARTVEYAGRSIELTSTEFDLLEVLVRSAGHAVSREELSKTVFGRRLFPEDRNIDVHVSNLRRKLGSRGAGTERIKTLRGTGYIYALSPSSAGHVESQNAAASDE
jgi:two-component system response regulator CpxR